MTEISRSALFGRLNPTSLKAIESATAFCKMRGNPYVELVHWIHILLQDPQNDLGALRSRFQLDDSKLARDVVAALDSLPRGATAISDFSPQVEEAVEKGWLYASLMFQAGKVRSGHLMFGMLKTPTLRNVLFAISPEFRKIQVDALGDEFDRIVAGSSEITQSAPAGAAESGGGEAGATGVAGSGEALGKYSVDLTERARKGEIDQIVGRDAEIRQVIDILLRRRQNNPILCGEAGVGKTAVAEGFARRIVDGDVPPALKDVTLRSLDIGLLQAGAGVKGEFEKRLRQVIDEVESSPKPIILFIDEAHTLIGAGGQAGTGDAANLLKPALARGRLRTVAATTWAEYRQYFEKDPALTRRFQTVNVGEPDTGVAVAMIRSVAPMMEAHHKVIVLDEAIEAAVKLSQRYIPARQLPDKAVSLLDTAAARVAVSQHATPAPVENRRRRIELLQMELEIATREAEGQYAGRERIGKVNEALEEARGALEVVDAKWAAELAAIGAAHKARAALSASSAADADPAAVPAARAELERALAAVETAHGGDPMVFGEVDADAVAAVVGDWTGIPVGRMVKNEIASVLTIGDQLKRRVVGQDHAMDAIAKRIQTSRAKLDNPNKPVGVFMLCGPSGVGKTETAHVLSELLYAGDDSLIVINMSEFQEAHTVSTLKGAPAGYVGYGQGGVLTEAVRRRPYSVVLLDEVEKAHPDVHEMFFQVFDKGYMDDSEGRYIDFKNTLILLTSNVGTDLITSLSEDEEMKPDAPGLADALRPELLKVFPPALLGRLMVLPYYPLSPAMLQGIVRLQMDRVKRRIVENHDIAFEYAPAVVDLIVSRCTEVASGGRMIDAILTNTMLPELSIQLLEKQMDGEEISAIRVDVRDSAFVYAFETAEPPPSEAAAEPVLEPEPA
ncbi:MAG: clpV [Phenylobacterium sp.]|nr:clpV [Phenylobacterium sp.]